MERSGRRLSTTRWLALLAAVAAGAAQAQAQPQTPPPPASQPAPQPQQTQAQAPQGEITITEERWIAMSDQPTLALNEARQSILRRDFDAAAEHLRSAAAFLTIEGERASGETAQELKDTASTLDELANRAQQDDLHGLNELNQAAVRAHRALAADYHQLAQRAHETNDDRRAGHYLRAAGQHLEHGLAWSGHAAERGTVATLDAVRTGAGKLVEGSGWTAAKGGQLLSSLGTEIERSGRWIEPGQPAQAAQATEGATPTETPPPQPAG